MSAPDYDAIIIGGGFYGCCLALELTRGQALRTAILEREPDLLLRASYANQARVHTGYHYPRSLITGLRSCVNMPRFIDDYRDCIDDSFVKYYAVARKFSKVTAAQFRLFCRRIKAPIEPAPLPFKKLFNPDLIEDVFRVRETAFDAVKLRHRLAGELGDAGVTVLHNTEAVRLGRTDDDRLLEITCRSGKSERVLTAGQVANCTYSRINKLLVDSGLEPIPLNHELTEIAIVQAPPPLVEAGVTVMCGPFFSIMPFPPLGLHSFSHVRYTPHCAWSDVEAGDYRDPYALFDRLPKHSNWRHMISDAQRYMPVLADCRYVQSNWEVKTILPKNDVDDGRPILLKQDHGLANFSCIMGSKIDNVYDVLALVAPSPTV